MKKRPSGKKRTALLLSVTGAVLLIILSVLFLGEGILSSNQSNASMVAGIRFDGDYRVGDGPWQPIKKGEHIPSTDGDVVLRGQFTVTDPESGAPLGPLSPGMSVALYFNHIGGSVLLPGGEEIHFDAESDVFGEDACAVMWGAVTAPDSHGTSGDNTYTVTLKNPHVFGNESAVDDFLENMSISPGVYLESEVLEKGELERSIGTVITLAALIILGIAAFSTVIHISYSPVLWLIGLMSLFAGGYFSFDAFGVSVWSPSYVLNTRMLGLCMMLYMLAVFALITIMIGPSVKAVSAFVTTAASAVVLCCIIISLGGGVRFFDTWLFWAVAVSVASAVLAVCLVINLSKIKGTGRIFSLAGLLPLLAFIIDSAATGAGLWEGGFVSKLVFICVFMMALVIVLRIIPSHTNAAQKARELEAEQKALELELQESRISIMLSQLQPHFIFNTLNTIYHLCELDPDSARSTISSFSEYLRNNIDNLGRSEMIFFEKELSFVRTYLDIEKVRFDDELDISFDIGVSDFKLPVLTVQPLVENAVKHGTSKREGGASLSVATRETEQFYEIEISDTGVGFDTATPPEDGHKHIGISAVRERLHHLCGGTLTVTSTVGVGTTALIKIPKLPGGGSIIENNRS